MKSEENFACLTILHISPQLDTPRVADVGDQLSTPDVCSRLLAARNKSLELPPTNGPVRESSKFFSLSPGGKNVKAMDSELHLLSSAFRMIARAATAALAMVIVLMLTPVIARKAVASSSSCRTDTRGGF